MTDSTYLSYTQNAGNSIYDDLRDVITNISPMDTLFLNRFGKGKATQRYTEWLTDALATAAVNKAVEGNDPDATAQTAPARTGNHTQISRKTFRVSETMQATDSVEGATHYDYAMAKAMKELARDMEVSLISGTGNSGGASTARELTGILSWIATNVTTGTGSGNEALTEAMYNDNLQLCWDQGGRPNATYANAYQKRKISGFTTNVTRNLDASEKKQVAVVQLYDSEFGPMQIFLHRWVPTDTVLNIEDGKFEIGFLRGVKHKSLPDNGGGPKGMIEAEYTLKSLQEKASGKIIQLATS